MSYEVHWELIAMLLVVIAVLRKRMLLALLVVGAAIVWNSIAGGTGDSRPLDEQLGPIGMFLLALISLLPTTTRFGQGHAP